MKPVRIHLRHSTMIGSPTWVRTRDLRINSPSLYRLSYRGMEIGCGALESNQVFPAYETGGLPFALPAINIGLR